MLGRIIPGLSGCWPAVLFSSSPVENIPRRFSSLNSDMASFDKVTTNSTPTLAPKPIATAAPPPPPFTRERFFSDGDDDEEDRDLDEESEGEEEDEDIVNGEHGGDSLDLEKIRGENWSSRQTYPSSSGKRTLIFLFNCFLVHEVHAYRLVTSQITILLNLFSYIFKNTAQLRFWNS